jgi:hypothetical protein
MKLVARSGDLQRILMVVPHFSPFRSFANLNNDAMLSL